MRIDILSVVPELLDSPLSYSIVGRAIRKGLVDIHVDNIRKHGIGPRQPVDDIMTKSSICPRTGSS